MTPEKFTSIKFEGVEGMHPRIFCDYFASDLPDNIELDEPGPYDYPYSSVMEITNISVAEVKRVRALIEDNGGKIV